MQNHRRENGVSSHGLNHAVNFINVRVRKSLTAIMFAVLLGISGTVTVSKVQAETTSGASNTSGEKEETQESAKDTDSVLSDGGDSDSTADDTQKSVSGMTIDELFEYLMSIDSETMDSLYDEYPNLNDLIEQFSDEQKEELAEKFGQNNIEMATYSITKNLDGGEEGSSSTAALDYCLPAKTGYTFSGWKITSGSGKILSGNASNIYTNFGASYTSSDNGKYVTKTNKIDSDGTPYTNYKINQTIGTNGNTVYLFFGNFTEVANYTYTSSCSIRVNNKSSNLSSCYSDWSSRTSLPSTTLNSDYVFRHTLSGVGSTWTTLNHSPSAVTTNTKQYPMLILNFPTTLSGQTITLDFDIKNVYIHNNTTNAYEPYYYDTGSVGTTIKASSNMTVTAVWEPKSYTVTILSETSSIPLTVNDTSITKVSDTKATFTVTYGTPIYSSLGISATNDGTHSFLGFYDNPNKSSDGIKVWNDDGGYCLKDGTYWDSNGNWTYDGDITFYLHYTDKSITVTFDGNGATSGSCNDVTFAYRTVGQDFPASTESFQRTGYTLIGWTTTKNDSLTKVLYMPYLYKPIEGDKLTLYALWEKQPQIAVNCNITGSMGNKSTDFTYTLQLDKDTYANKAVTTYDVETDTTSELTADENGLLTFTLHNGEELQFTGLTADDLTDASTKISATGLTDAGYTVTTSTATSDDGKTATVTVTGTRDASVPTGNHISSNAENGLVVFGTLGLIAVAIGLYRKKNHA